MEKRIIANKETGKKELEVVLRQEIKAGDLEIDKEDTPEDIASKALKIYANDLKNQIIEESLRDISCDHTIGHFPAVEDLGDGKVRCKKCGIVFNLEEPKSFEDITVNNYKYLLHTIILFSGVCHNRYAISLCYNYMKKDFDHINTEDIFSLYKSSVAQYKSLSDMISVTQYNTRAGYNDEYTPVQMRNPLCGSPFDGTIGTNCVGLGNKPFGVVRPSIPLDYPDKDINLGNTRDSKNE